MSRRYVQIAVSIQQSITYQIHADCSNGDVRLTGGESDSDGTVEVCYNNIWGLIHVSGWGESDASVVCRQLGFLGPSEHYKCTQCTFFTINDYILNLL